MPQQKYIVEYDHQFTGLIPASIGYSFKDAKKEAKRYIENLIEELEECLDKIEKLKESNIA